MIIVPNDGDDDEAESELRWLSCDEREKEAESELRSWLSCDGDKGERQRRESDWEGEEEAESDWESEGPKGFVSGLFNQNAPNDAVLGGGKKGWNNAVLS